MTDDIDIIEAKENYKKFIQKIRKHATRKWIELVRALDRPELRNLFNPSRDKKWLCTKVQLFQLLAIVDAAIRMSNDHRGGNPTEYDYAKAIEYYLDSDYRWMEVIENRNKNPRALFHAMTYMGGEQFILRSQVLNMFGRAKLLFSKYEERIKQEIGLGLDEIFWISFSLYAYCDKGNSYFNAKSLSNCNIPFLSLNNLTQYLDFFSADYKKYRDYSEKYCGVARSDRYGFKALCRYPIVKISGYGFCVPIAHVLIEASTMNLFHVILNSFHNNNQRKSFLDAFGKDFEEYVVKLLASCGFKLKPCDTIAGISGKRAEVYTVDRNDCIVIECKRFAFKRDTLYIGSINDIDEEIANLREAFLQIENTFQFLPKNNLHGLIVTYGDIPISNYPDLFNIIKEYSQKNYWNSPIADNNIILASLSELEELTSNSPDQIEAVLKAIEQKPPGQKGNIKTTMDYVFKNLKRVHPLLKKQCDQVFEKSKVNEI